MDATETLTAPLTDEEREVVVLLARGATREDAARRLLISTVTLARRMQSVYEKTGAQNTVHAVAILCQRGELDGLAGRGRPTVLPNASDGPACKALYAKLMTELDWRAFQELRIAYRVCSELGL